MLRLFSLRKTTVSAPLEDIPVPRLDLAMAADPVAAIVGAAEFRQMERFFTDFGERSHSLLSPTALALLYAVVCNLRPDHVVEIGTYRGGTAEALSRALEANQHGMLHTVGPFDAECFEPILAQWPRQLRQRTRYYPIDSMAFFMKAAAQMIRPGVVLVDGNHDYEFATFDIYSAARFLEPGGFIFIDNVSQSGPYRASVDFLAANPGWRPCGRPPSNVDEARAFDRDRFWVLQTDFLILRAPSHHLVDRTPKTFGEIEWPSLDVEGLTIVPARAGQRGLLKVQCVLRAFSHPRVLEIITDAECLLQGGAEPVHIRFERSWTSEPGFDSYRVEPWLCWQGDAPLELAALPTPLGASNITVPLTSALVSAPS